jgi:uncharacterized protein (TIGR02145 family)
MPFQTTLNLWTAGILTLTLSYNVHAQVCNPANPPVNLVSTYSAATGARLQWDAVPGSIGVQIKATLPSGANITQRIVGFERSQFLIPNSLLTPGTYTWRVQAACSAIPPYDVTPISVSSGFTVPGSSCPASVTDVDGNVYSTVSINGQCWMQSNLAVERYRNGNGISTGINNTLWSTTVEGAFAVYEDLSVNKGTYGLLYNWFAVQDASGLCPTGWHIPSVTEWMDLSTYLDGDSLSGATLKSVGTLSAGTGLWQTPNEGATNSSGFTGLPGGLKDKFGNYFDKSLGGFFWSSTESSPGFSWFREIYFGNTLFYEFESFQQLGLSVRCLKD